MKTKKAINTVAYYTVAASITGAIPVPASSAAIVGENAIMINHISAVYGQKITKKTIVKSLGIIGGANIIARNLFIEGAKVLSWGTGSVWAAPLLSLLGATTAGMQTYIIGMIAIEIVKNEGGILDFDTSSEVISSAKSNYSDFLKKWKNKEIPNPEFQ